LIRKQRELDDAKRELDLTVEKRIQEGLTTARDQARKEAEEELKLKVLDKEQVISALQKQIEDLKRRADQGSQQAQGEVMELELETILRAKFPRDLIEPVPKGEFGGDVLHRVLGPLGQPCGTILWESKRTKNWTDSWLPKLREDQRAAKAEVAILMSQALPKDVDTFELIDGVWVTHPRTALPVADMLRHSLLEVALARHGLPRTPPARRWVAVCTQPWGSGAALTGDGPQGCPARSALVGSPLSALSRKGGDGGTSAASLGTHNYGVADLVASNPFITVRGAAGKLGVAFTTAQRAVDRLENQKALVQVSEGKRDRVFCAKALLGILEESARLAL